MWKKKNNEISKVFPENGYLTIKLSQKHRTSWIPNLLKGDSKYTFQQIIMSTYYIPVTGLLARAAMGFIFQ